MIGCRNLNLMLLLYYFTLHTVYTKHKIQEVENEQIIDGAKFMKEVVDGTKINSKPQILMFTAPYKLCEGVCSDENSVMGFPVYLGNYAKKVYKDTYIKNFNAVEPDKRKSKKTNPPKTNKTTKQKRKTPTYNESTTSTQPPLEYDHDDGDDDHNKLHLNKKIDCSCPYLDPNICYKKRVPALREKKEIIVEDIKKLFTLYRKTKEIN